MFQSVTVLFNIVPQAVNKLPSLVILHQVKKQATRRIWNYNKFSCENMSGHSVPIFFCNVVSDVFGKHWLEDISMQCWARNIKITLYRLFPGMGKNKEITEAGYGLQLYYTRVKFSKTPPVALFAVCLKYKLFLKA